jgi:hypothetical protein
MSKSIGSWSEVYDGRALKTKEGHARKDLHHDKTTTPSRIVTRRAFRALAAAQNLGDFKPAQVSEKPFNRKKFIEDETGELVLLDSDRGRFLASLAAARAPSTAASRSKSVVTGLAQRVAAAAKNRADLKEALDQAKANNARVRSRAARASGPQKRAAAAAVTAAQAAYNTAPVPVKVTEPAPRPAGAPTNLTEWETKWVSRWTRALNQWHANPTNDVLASLIQLDREYVNRVDITPAQRADQSRQQADTELENLLRDHLTDFSQPVPLAPQTGDAPAVDSTKPQFIDFLQGFGSPETAPEGLAKLAACLSSTQLGRRFYRSYLFERTTKNAFDAADSTEFDMSLIPTRTDVKALYDCFGTRGVGVNAGSLPSGISNAALAQGIIQRRL